MKKSIPMQSTNVKAVSVLVPAWNEATTILNVLHDILAQHGTSWALIELVVMCDGCEDRTASTAGKLTDPRIKVIEYNRRKGKAIRVNQFLHQAQGDILVIIDADVRLGSVKVIDSLIKEFGRSPDVMLVGGNLRNYRPKGFFQNAILTSYEVSYASRDMLKGGHNIFGCSGSCLALRKKFARSISIPTDVISEDVFLYFSCLNQGYFFRHARQAIVHHKLAANLKDFLRQVFRNHPESVNTMLKGRFGNLVKDEYRRPLGFYLSNISRVFLKNPLGTAYMITLKLLCKPWFSRVSGEYQLGWFTAISTK